MAPEIPDRFAEPLPMGQPVRLLDLIAGLDRLMREQEAGKPVRRGRPERSREAVMLQAVVLMVPRRLPSVYALLALLRKPEIADVRARLCDARVDTRGYRYWFGVLARMADIHDIVPKRPLAKSRPLLRRRLSNELARRCGSLAHT